MKADKKQEVAERFRRYCGSAVVPFVIANDPRLSKFDIRVFSSLVSFLRPGHKKVWPKRSSIAWRIGCESLCNISRSTAKLAACGIISIEAGVGHGASAIYHFVNISDAEQAFERWKGFMPDLDMINSDPHWFTGNQPDIGPIGAGITTAERKAGVRTDPEILEMAAAERMSREREARFSPDAASREDSGFGTLPLIRVNTDCFNEKPMRVLADSLAQSRKNPTLHRSDAMFSNPVFSVERNSAELRAYLAEHPEYLTSEDDVGQEEIARAKEILAKHIGKATREELAREEAAEKGAYEAVAAFSSSGRVKMLSSTVEPARRPGRPVSEDAKDPKLAEVVMEMPVVGGHIPTYGITRERIERYRTMFPGIDAELECRKAIQWLEDNPTRRKTLKGAAAFLTRWMTKAQDRGHHNPGQRSYGAPRQMLPDGPDPSGVGYWLKGKKYTNENAARAAYGDISHFDHSKNDGDMSAMMREAFGDDCGW